MSKEWRRGPGDQPCFALLLQAAHRIALEHGIPSGELFRGTGLDESVLKDPYTIIGRHQALAYYQNLAAAGPPGIGLDVGLATTLNERGSHGHLLLAVDTIQSAIQLAQEFYDLVYLHVDWAARQQGNLFYHRFTEGYPLGGARQFCMDRALVIVQVGAEYFTAGKLKPTLLTLDGPRPSYAARYDDLFQCPVKFSQEATELQYPSEALGHRVTSHDQQVLDVMKSLCQNLLEKLHGRQDFVSEVRRAIHLKSGSFPNIDQVAERLGCAPRTLRRRLQQEQESFQKILDEERSAVASDYLRNSTLSIQQVAERCGFNDPQNFSQAFRRWTGRSPSEFRKNTSQDR
ncbi:helix-turn-helix transcriptional regulator [Pseudohalioglobus lutimaris]|uniref:AraC family transcriptional regulator n=1 Tax=Pseudohalioglobus lutimaris TaxID=1737061 RepID=A0A2N5X2L8_9GAMM|nr:AraC family transcriptional regulator [Pseudohalioglobus lutimaris]PLW68732.1 AraC family transcriptional regulator [Pseudohalioglobus lutimaris]